jgi:hypothetical protein
LLLASPVDRPIVSVTEDVFGPKILERNWLPRLPSGELVMPDASPPGFDVNAERATEVFAGFVMRLNICPKNPD